MLSSSQINQKKTIFNSLTHARMQVCRYARMHACTYARMLMHEIMHHLKCEMCHVDLNYSKKKKKIENENQIKSLFLTFQHRRVLQHVSRDQQHGKSIPPC